MPRGQSRGGRSTTGNKTGRRTRQTARQLNPSANEIEVVPSNGALQTRLWVDNGEYG